MTSRHSTGRDAPAGSAALPRTPQVVDRDIVEMVAEALWRDHLPSDMEWAEWEKEAVLWRLHYIRRAERAIAGTPISEPHNIVSWIESHRAGWFQCSCGESFKTEGFESEDKSMGALIALHQEEVGYAGAHDATADQAGQQ